jgi:dihydroorotate dehydrogenase (NAD+) catalytic subunit
VAAALEGVAGIAGLELNLSGHADRVAAIVAATRAATLLPLLAKLPPLYEQIGELARAVAGAGADAITVAAPPHGLAIDQRSGERVAGRLCGPAQRPLALRLVAAAAASVDIPVIGCGGVTIADDARQLLEVGAAAAQVGSALLADPGTAVRIADELRGSNAKRKT